MGDLLKSFLPRVVQDILTSAAAILASHGVIAADQEQQFIGATFFLAMLIINYFVAMSRKANAAQAGAAAVGGILPPSTATAIAKGKTP